jgi:hypothetical protein
MRSGKFEAQTFMIPLKKNVATYLMPVTWCVLDCVLSTCGVTLTILFSPSETISNETMRGPTTLMSDMRSGDDHSKERSPLRTTPNELSLVL